MASSLKTAFSAFDAESKKVVKYTFMLSDLKTSLRQLKDALKDSIKEIEGRNARIPNAYQRGVIYALVEIMDEITVRMKQFHEIEKKYKNEDLMKQVRYNNSFNSIDNLFETAHECVNEIMTYRGETVDDVFEDALNEVDDFIGLVKSLSVPKTPTPKAKTPTPKAKTPTPKAKTPTPKAKTPSPKPKSKTARCPRGTRRNKKTGNCESSTRTRAIKVADAPKVADVASPAASAPKMKRCPRGSRRNKKTGNCDKN